MRAESRGFTLIELVIGIIVFAIALTTIISFLAPQARRSADPIMQVRATELAQSLFDEITAKAYDENSYANGSQVRCNEDINQDGELLVADGEIACSAVLGAEEGTRDAFDDVDDYHNFVLDYNLPGSFTNALGESIVLDGRQLYAGFRAEITVSYAGQFYAELPAPERFQDSKRVDVLITLPNGDELTFSQYRSNF